MNKYLRWPLACVQLYPVVGWIANQSRKIIIEFVNFFARRWTNTERLEKRRYE